MTDSNNKKYVPGDGIRSLKTTNFFRVVNYELYSKPNKVIMILGLIGLAGSLGYITYMRYKYESLGYYVAVQPDGQQTYIKKKSKWD